MLLAAHGEAIAAIERRVGNWKVDGADFDAYGPGLEASWRSARRAMNRALDAPTADALHQWRKRLKDHWYHARLMAPVWPEMMQHHVALADLLGEMLGDARDLANLSDALVNVPEAATVRDEALRQEQLLVGDARSLGTRFLSEPASCLSRRWRGWWDIWRAG
jgi:hypothetical protein